MNEATNHKRVSPEGQLIGSFIVKLTAQSITVLASEGEPDERCKTCAFREGVVPNGCLQTMADVIKCVMEGIPFYCHQDKDHRTLCHGWFAARHALKGKTRSVPWDFSLKE